MARQIRVILACDVDGSEDGVRTMSLEFKGRAYSLELCAAHRSELDSFLEAHQAAAEAHRFLPRRQQPGTTSGSATTTSTEPVSIRDWAHVNGYVISDQGRIPPYVREAFEAATA